MKMKGLKSIVLAGGILAVLSFGLFGGTASASLIASDDAQSYSSFSYGSNGGSGFGAATYVEGSGGGVFLETGGAAIDGAKSIGTYSNSGGGNAQAWARSITSPTTEAEYSLSARFNLDNSVAFSGFNLKSALGATFGASELLSFGMRPASGNNGIFVGGSVDNFISLGAEVRGAVVDFDVIYNTTTGLYDIGAKFRASGSFTRVSGSLKATGQTATQVGFANFNTGTNQNLIADNLAIQTVPEPASLGVMMLAGVGILRRRGRTH
jgi:hypothetical protein